MTAKDGKHLGKCPFWSETSKKCRISNGGLFIPLDDHVEIFCKTPEFSSCMQHVLRSGNHTHLMEKVRVSDGNRRKYLRIETSQRITLVKNFQSGSLDLSSSSNASTLDVSKGGMRVEIEDPLTHDTMVQFSFDDSYPQSLHHVIAQVQWCHKQIDRAGYQAGISFLGDHIREVMGRYWGVQHEPGK